MAHPGHLVRSVVKRMRRQVEHRLEARIVERSVEHVHGPEAVDCGPDELLAICVVRNGSAHVRTFIEHHLDIGIRHIVFLDNGSTDATVALARRYAQVTILRTECPYRRYENAMKRYLAYRFTRQRWNLCVDIDERFDYPLSKQVRVPDLLAYLRERRFTAMVAQMLDLFPDLHLSALGESADDDFLATHANFDLSDIRRTPYRYGSPSNPAIEMHWGGVRRSLFGTDNGLTKAPLTFVDDEIELFVHFHHAENARLADISGVLLHYPFAGEFAAKVAEAVRSGRYGRITGPEYEAYWRGLTTRKEQAMRGPSARPFVGVDPLVEDGFLVVSSEYRQWAEGKSPAP